MQLVYRNILSERKVPERYKHKLLEFDMVFGRITSDWTGHILAFHWGE